VSRSSVAAYVIGAGVAGLLPVITVGILLGNPLLPARGPGAVQATLGGAMSLGVACDSGEKDNVPSGLYQWHCRGTDRVAGFDVLVDGNDAGVAEIDVITPTDDTDVARAAIARVFEAVPPLTSVDGLATYLDQALEGWDGTQLFLGTDGLRIAAECLGPSQFGDGQCLVLFRGPDPIKPMLR